jgi:hypothetical protein
VLIFVVDFDCAALVTMRPARNADTGPANAVGHEVDFFGQLSIVFHRIPRGTIG